MDILYGIIAFTASLIGAISGIGGGVIIKPVLDGIGGMGVATISFLSGCTVLAMSFVSVLRNRSVKINLSVSLYLAIGAAVGGVVGKLLFQIMKEIFDKPDTIGLVQAIILLLINVGVFFYMLNKDTIRTRSVTNPVFSVGIGLGLGVLSSFLGIGGGPVNIAVLYYFYAMPPKTTVINSLFIILCSQLTSLISTLVTAAVPPFAWLTLLLMCAAGICGALTGSRVSKRMSEAFTATFFQIVLVLLIVLNVYNIIKFAVL